MNPTTDYSQAARPSQGPPGVNGAARNSRIYYDAAGRRRTSQTEVPVDQFGHICGVQFQCRKCKGTKWVAPAVAAKGIPVCDIDETRMKEVPVRAASSLPWNALRAMVRGPGFRPIWGLAIAATAGTMVDGGHVPPFVPLVAAIPVALVAARVTRIKLSQKVWSWMGLATPNDEQRARVGRSVGYCTSVACAWLAVAASTGIDPHTVGGRGAWTILALTWFLPAATWWRWLRRIAAARAARPVVAAVEPEPEPDTEIPMDPDEAQTRRVWTTIVAVRKDTPIGTRSDGTQVKAARAGKLVDTWLEEWHPVEGGWAATVVGPDGVYTGEAYVNSRGAIASAFRMKTPMVTVIPDADDENRALVLCQRTSPILGEILWPGPDSINGEQGTAPLAVYADGDTATYEIYRRGWGSPHVAAFGTTGVGKSEFLNLLFGIDRWASYEDDKGVRHGMVASFLIDPQQGQSFADFVDDLAGPVATTLAEAKILVQAFTNEMLRRNRYLTREAKTWDPRRRKWRKGRKWWDPLIDGPILVLVIDEAHAFLADREFCAMVTAGGRMWRKCGGQLRLSTHTPLLADLGGSIALRDMLTGGLVAVFRTANSLSGPVAFNGRLPVDPRTIPADPGSCYILSSLQPKPMLARAMYVKDWYDWIYDQDDNPIGHPAPLPPETLAAFGVEYANWARHAAAGIEGPFVAANGAAPVAEVPTVCVDAVRLVLGLGAHEAMDMEAIIGKLAEHDLSYSVRTVRDALAKLRKSGEVASADGRHSLTDSALARVLKNLPATTDGLSDAA